MKNKTLNIAKALLLGLTLTVMTLGMMPAAMADITITCDGSDNTCAVLETDDVIIIFELGRATSVIIEF